MKQERRYTALKDGSINASLHKSMTFESKNKHEALKESSQHDEQGVRLEAGTGMTVDECEESKVQSHAIRRGAVARVKFDQPRTPNIIAKQHLKRVGCCPVWKMK